MKKSNVSSFNIISLIETDTAKVAQGQLTAMKAKRMSGRRAESASAWQRCREKMSEGVRWTKEITTDTLAHLATWLQATAEGVRREVGPRRWVGSPRLLQVRGGGHPGRLPGGHPLHLAPRPRQGHPGHRQPLAGSGSAC